jgi:hypothetical protein
MGLMQVLNTYSSFQRIRRTLHLSPFRNHYGYLCVDYDHAVAQ